MKSAKALVVILTSTYKGRKIYQYIEEITRIAEGYEVNVMDPEFNMGPIDNESNRLNIKTDKNGKIKQFSIG